ncbi:MAG TPA: serine protease [Gammaproteobacteria bacterium]|nr:trypsin-like peptidase domain-containing protein [Chromatiaceae bacterium]MCW5585293.1 trypsin-like peptidase domain-containing protein [Chromatiales bacterium]HOP15924.1 serine protease [Gammaproteobacteria bacterium]
MISTSENASLCRFHERLAGSVKRFIQSTGFPAFSARLLTGLVILLCTTTAPVFALDSQVIFERNEHAVYQIHVVNRETGKKRSIGSGFIFDRPQRLATNYHVVSQFIEKPERYELRFISTDGAEGPLRLVGVDAVHDLALVEADAPFGTPLQVGEPPAKGAALYAMGNPLDLGLTIAAGTNGGVLSQTDDSRILFSGSLNAGMSGGPTFDDQGIVVGINVSTARNDISFIVPTRYLQSLSLANVARAEDFRDAITQQIRDYQRRYLQGMIDGDWPSTNLRKMRIPGAISPTVRCWDASPKPKDEHLYQRFSISCKNENDIYLTDKLEVGKVLYEYLWIESDQLESLRFYRLYQALNNSQFSSKADEDDVERFRCDTQFVDLNGQQFKTTICARSYKLYPGLSDVLFTAAMVGHDRQGFIFNLDLSGTDFTAASRLIVRMLEGFEWLP